MKCDRCEKEMTDENGMSIIGVSVGNMAISDDQKEFLQKQFGKYPVIRTYSFCFECFLDSLMGR